MTLRDVLNNKARKIFIQDDDTIELQEFRYKPGQVFALSGVGNAKAVPIYPSKRETLADILFTENGVLSNNSAKRSEVYLLRGRAPSVAYHLDAQNVSRILVAAETELRPNDIVFVADRPMISFARVLSEVTPLRMLLRDIRLDTLP
jgi:polysaccharide export outer membrane protein